MRKQLAWSLRDDPGGELFEISSSPWEKEHVIKFPQGATSDPPRPIEYLHELMNAQMAEVVHPLFSTSYFASETPAEVLDVVAPALRAAGDWFVNVRLMDLCQDDFRQEIQEHVDLLLDSAQSRNALGEGAFLMMSAGFILAQSIKYLGAPVRPQGDLAGVVDVFLACRTERPSVYKLQNLANNLLALYCPYRVRIAVDDGQDVWYVELEE